MLYILPFRQNSLGRLTLLILPATLTFHVGINLLVEKELSVATTTAVPIRAVTVAKQGFF